MPRSNGLGGGRGGGWMKGRRRTNALAPNAVRLASSRLHNYANKKKKKKLATRLLESSIKHFLEKSPKIYQMTLKLVQILKISWDGRLWTLLRSKTMQSNHCCLWGPPQKLVPIGLVRKSAYEEVIIAFNQSGNLHTPVASWIK